jgi:hypothetical protein
MEVINFTSMPTPFFQSPGGAATISAGASILSNAFGSGSSGMSTQRSQARKLRMQAYKQDRRHYEKMYLSHVKGAKAAGLHPLFALGSGGGGSSPGIAIPGQSERGSFASDAVQAAQSAYQQHSLYERQKDLIDAQAELARARTLEQVTSNDNSDAIVDRAYYGQINPVTQEKKKGEVMAMGNPKHPEQSANVKSPWVKFRMGDQEVWLPTEEISEFFDNFITMGGAAFTYHGNDGVDWDRVQYWHRHGTMKGFKPTVSVKRIRDWDRRRAVKATAKGLRRRRNVKRARQLQYDYGSASP